MEAYESMVRRSCGTMSIETFRNFLNDADATTRERLLENFRADEAALRSTCAESYAENSRRQLSGGGTIGNFFGATTKTKKRKTKSSRAPADRMKIYQQNLLMKAMQGIRWKDECRNYDGRCVRDPLKRSGRCIPPQYIAGNKDTSRFSDGYCYDVRTLGKRVRDTKSFRSPSNASKMLTIEDAAKMDSTRLRAYVEHNLLAHITGYLRTQLDRKESDAKESFVEMYNRLHPSSASDSYVAKIGNAVWNTMTSLAKFGAESAKFFTRRGMSLATFIIAQPRVARFALILVKRMLRSVCQRVAIHFKLAEYKYRSTGGQLVDAFTPGEVAEIVRDEITVKFLNSEGGKNAIGAMTGAVGGFITGTLRSIPGMGGVANLMDSVGGYAKDALNEGISIGIEFAIYEKDVRGAFNSVMDIIMIVLNPVTCVEENAIVQTSDKTLDGTKVSPVAGGAYDDVRRIGEALTPPPPVGSCTHFVMGAHAKMDNMSLFSTYVRVNGRQYVVCMPLRALVARVKLIRRNRQKGAKKSRVRYKLFDAEMRLSIAEERRAIQESKRPRASVSEDGFLESIVTSIGRWLLENATPGLLRKTFGAADKFTRGWLSTMLKTPFKIMKSFWSNRMLVNMALIIYTFLKLTICAAYLPENGVRIVKRWLMSRLKKESRIFRAIDASIDCVFGLVKSGVASTATYGVSLILSLPSLIGNCASAIAEILFVPMWFVQKITSYFFPSSAAAAITTVASSFAQNGLTGWIAQLRQYKSLWSALRDLSMDDYDAPVKFLQLLLMTNVGYKILRALTERILYVLVNYVGFIFMSKRAANAVKRMMNAKRRRIWSGALFELLTIAQTYSHVVGLIRWIVTEAYSLYTCFVTGESCCLNDRFVKEWTKRLAKEDDAKLKLLKDRQKSSGPLSNEEFDEIRKEINEIDARRTRQKLRKIEDKVRSFEPLTDDEVKAQRRLMRKSEKLERERKRIEDEMTENLNAENERGKSKGTKSGDPDRLHIPLSYPDGEDMEEEDTANSVRKQKRTKSTKRQRRKGTKPGDPDHLHIPYSNPDSTDRIPAENDVGSYPHDGEESDPMEWDLETLAEDTAREAGKTESSAVGSYPHDGEESDPMEWDLSEKDTAREAAKSESWWDWGRRNIGLGGGRTLHFLHKGRVFTLDRRLDRLILTGPRKPLTYKKRRPRR